MLCDDTNLGMIVSVGTRLTRDGEAGADLGHAGLCSMTSVYRPKAVEDIL